MFKKLVCQWVKKDSGLKKDGLNEDFVRTWRDAVMTYHNM